MKIGKKLRLAQSIMEYLGVATVFTAAGILFFTAANRNIILHHRGMLGDVGRDTLIGNIIGPNNAIPWPDVPEWDPDFTESERDLNAVGYCQGLDDDPNCTEGQGTQGSAE